MYFLVFCIASTLSNSTTPVLYAFVDQSVKVTSCVECKLCRVQIPTVLFAILYVQNANYPSQNVKIHSTPSKLNLSKSGFLKKVKKTMNDLTPHADCRDPWCAVCICEICHLTLLYCRCRH